MTVDKARWDPSGRPAAGPNRRPRTWPGLAVLVVLVVALGAGCDGRRSDAGTGATVREETTTTSTSTTAPADPYAVPEVIDAAYVDRVLAALYKVDGDAARIIVREGEVVPEAANALRAIYAPDELSAQLRIWEEAVGKRFEGFHDPPGDIHGEVKELGTASSTCIFGSVVTDYAARSSQAPPPSATFISLVPKDPGADPAALNPTPWVIGLDLVSVDGAPPPDPCADA